MLTDSQGACMLAWGKSSHGFGLGLSGRIASLYTETVTYRNPITKINM